MSGCKGNQQETGELKNYAYKKLTNPNFLFILTEDIGCYLNVYGDSTARTPHIDKLAAEGVIYTNVYSVAGVCAPSRSSLITGMYPVSIGAHHMRTRLHGDLLPVSEYSVVPPPQVKCFTEIFRKNGYYCANAGKRDFQFDVPMSAFHDLGKEINNWKGREKGQPFFCIQNIFVTHESQVWARKDDSLRISPDKVTVPPYYPETSTVKNDLARVYSNIELMDKQVGEIINELKKDNLFDSTIIIFLSDHGGPLPRQKREITKAGLHVPMIIRYPWKVSHQVDSQLISFVDMAPTFLSLAGIEPPEYMQGKPFEGEYKNSPRKYVFGARDRMDMQYDRARSVSDGRYFYVKNYYPGKSWYQDIEFRKQMPMMQELLALHEKGRLNSVQEIWFYPSKPAEQLFDTWTDSYEIKDLAQDTGYSKIIKKLRTQLSNWQDEVNDKGHIPEKEMVANMWPDFKQPVTDSVCFQQVKNGRIKLTCSEKGASILFHVSNGEGIPATDEPVGWNLYNDPVAIATMDTIHAFAVRVGYRNSSLTNYTIY